MTRFVMWGTLAACTVALVAHGWWMGLLHGALIAMAASWLTLDWAQRKVDERMS